MRLVELVRQLDARQAFFARVDRRGPEECWPWINGIRDPRKVVGSFYYANKHWNARRVMWTFVNGPPPKGMHVAAACGNTNCLNPAHLRVQHTTHEHYRKFDHDEVRARLAAGENPQALAVEYGVTDGAIVRLRMTRAEVRRVNARHRQWQRDRRLTPCPGGCGRMVWRRTSDGRIPFCPACTAAKRTRSVRKTTLLCAVCRKWKPDEAFPHCQKNRARRHRHSQCRSCNTLSRRALREARKVKCARCGEPRSHPNDRGSSGADSGLCVRCYRLAKREAKLARQAAKQAA